MRRLINNFLLSASLLVSVTAVADESAESAFIKLLFAQGIEDLNRELTRIDAKWKPSHVPMAVEIMSLAQAAVGQPLHALLQRKTGQQIEYRPNAWFQWWWQQNVPTEPAYAHFKSVLYGFIDDRFSGYFSTDRPATIRLDEVRWGGVRQDGIPPLRQPAMVAADKAGYLADSNVVFGIEINGDARAYPKRILAWHEMFVDQIGGIDFAGVYCTLCGAVILYKTVVDGTRHHLGTSGFLYRSNKLMYDKDTQSLWNTTWGEPVVGPLAGKGIRLERSYLVTTTWGEWKRRHPDTTVLSLQTGYLRNYAEGEAYKDYFATDDLMFSIATADHRLRNKDEILALTFPDHSDDTLAIAADFLAKTPVYADRLGSLDLVVLTDTTGANRVYANGEVKITRYDGADEAVDNTGGKWQVREDALHAVDGRTLARLPAHRAFWFGWHAAYPDTRLVR